MDVRLLYRQGVTLLGISRKGRRFRDRVRSVRVEAGDILLLLGPEDRLPDVVIWLGCLPLAERGLEITERGRRGSPPESLLPPSWRPALASSTCRSR